MCSFSDFHYGFRSSQLTADLLTVVSDRIVSAFNRSGATLAVALNIFNNFGIAGLLHKLKFYGIFLNSHWAASGSSGWEIFKIISC